MVEQVSLRSSAASHSPSSPSTSFALPQAPPAAAPVVVAQAAQGSLVGGGIQGLDRFPVDQNILINLPNWASDARGPLRVVAPNVVVWDRADGTQGFVANTADGKRVTGSRASDGTTTLQPTGYPPGLAPTFPFRGRVEELGSFSLGGAQSLEDAAQAKAAARNPQVGEWSPDGTRHFSATLRDGSRVTGVQNRDGSASVWAAGDHRMRELPKGSDLESLPGMSLAQVGLNPNFAPRAVDRRQDTVINPQTMQPETRFVNYATGEIFRSDDAADQTPLPFTLDQSRAAQRKLADQRSEAERQRLDREHPVWTQADYDRNAGVLTPEQLAAGERIYQEFKRDQAAWERRDAGALDRFLEGRLQSEIEKNGLGPDPLDTLVPGGRPDAAVARRHGEFAQDLRRDLEAAAPPGNNPDADLSRVLAEGTPAGDAARGNYWGARQLTGVYERAVELYQKGDSRITPEVLGELYRAAQQGVSVAQGSANAASMQTLEIGVETARFLKDLGLTAAVTVNPLLGVVVGLGQAAATQAGVGSDGITQGQADAENGRTGVNLVTDLLLGGLPKATGIGGAIGNTLTSGVVGGGANAAVDALTELSNGNPPPDQRRMAVNFLSGGVANLIGTGIGNGMDLARYKSGIGKLSGPELAEVVGGRSGQDLAALRRQSPDVADALEARAKQLAGQGDPAGRAIADAFADARTLPAAPPRPVAPPPKPGDATPSAPGAGTAKPAGPPPSPIPAGATGPERVDGPVPRPEDAAVPSSRTYPLADGTTRTMPLDAAEAYRMTRSDVYRTGDPMDAYRQWPKGEMTMADAIVLQQRATGDDRPATMSRFFHDVSGLRPTGNPVEDQMQLQAYMQTALHDQHYLVDPNSAAGERGAAARLSMFVGDGGKIDDVPGAVARSSLDNQGFFNVDPFFYEDILEDIKAGKPLKTGPDGSVTEPRALSEFMGVGFGHLDGDRTKLAEIYARAVAAPPDSPARKEAMVEFGNFMKEAVLEKAGPKASYEGYLQYRAQLETSGMLPRFNEIMEATDQPLDKRMADMAQLFTATKLPADDAVARRIEELRRIVPEAEYNQQFKQHMEPVLTRWDAEMDGVARRAGLPPLKPSPKAGEAPSVGAAGAADGVSAAGRTGAAPTVAIDVGSSGARPGDYVTVTDSISTSLTGGMNLPDIEAPTARVPTRETAPAVGPMDQADAERVFLVREEGYAPDSGFARASADAVTDAARKLQTGEIKSYDELWIELTKKRYDYEVSKYAPNDPFRGDMTQEFGYTRRDPTGHADPNVAPPTDFMNPSTNSFTPFQTKRFGAYVPDFVDRLNQVGSELPGQPVVKSPQGDMEQLSIKKMFSVDGGEPVLTQQVRMNFMGTPAQDVTVSHARKAASDTMFEAATAMHELALGGLSRQDTVEALARMYKRSVEAMPNFRGTASVAFEALQATARSVGVELPGVKPGKTLDVMAITAMSEDQFVREFPTYFDGPIRFSDPAR